MSAVSHTGAQVSISFSDGCQPAESPKSRHSARSEAQSRNPPHWSRHAQPRAAGVSPPIPPKAVIPRSESQKPSFRAERSAVAESIPDGVGSRGDAETAEKQSHGHSARSEAQEPSFRAERSAVAESIPDGVGSRGDAETAEKQSHSHSARSEAQSRNPPSRRTARNSERRVRPGTGVVRDCPPMTRTSRQIAKVPKRENAKSQRRQDARPPGASGGGRSSVGVLLCGERLRVISLTRLSMSNRL
jgi:hypothetical protein